MVFRRETVEERLKELDVITTELSGYQSKTLEDLKGSLSLRWSIERGLIAGANLIFDVADHILSSSFSLYSDAYEDSLKMLYDNSVISEDLFSKIKGLGGFRNILVHEYLKIDLGELHKNYNKSIDLFPGFSLEILEWMDKPHSDRE